ncbi:hypothetical protein DL240_05075 [Lujinxingia litoralis]|uniref:Acyl-CoA dehydrogenase n=1 Tax=Lujinxingia litoralis TaxID=2211119 RepID=A0A328C6H2_9DELT|nr:acyl-CoA dehydrogenase family protein [Lujinxingia litoralis]RAL23535.1 hypothetical protein DL240_05075 [Lujinxingia litoralis]
MNFQLSEDQQILRQTLRRFADDKLAESASARDATPQSTWPTGLTELGLWSLAVPEHQGGAGFDLLTGALAVEELASRDASVATAIALSNAVVVPALAMGNHALLESAAMGTPPVAAAWCSPGASTQRSIHIVAPPGATHAVFRAPEDGQRPASWGLIELAQPSDASKTLGLRGVSRLQMSDSPQGELLVEQTSGDRDFLIRAGALLAAVGVGIATGALRLALSYAEERHQFQRPLHGFQAIQFKLATMATELEGARQLTYRACLSASPRDSRLAFRLARECAFTVADEALQIHGGYGYTREYPVERHFRDAVQLSTLALWEHS